MRRILAGVGIIAIWTWYVEREARKRFEAEQTRKRLMFYRGAVSRGEGDLAERFRRAEQ